MVQETTQHHPKFAFPIVCILLDGLEDHRAAPTGELILRVTRGVYAAADGIEAGLRTAKK